jgi:hypothetical protein
MILYNLLVYFFSTKVSPFAILSSKLHFSHPPNSQSGNSNMAVDLNWYAPSATRILLMGLGLMGSFLMGRKRERTEGIIGVICLMFERKNM